MTPEQRAMQPTHPPANAAEKSDNIRLVVRLLDQVREILRERQDLQYPKGHPERPKNNEDDI